MSFDRKVLLFHAGVVHSAILEASDGRVSTMCGERFPPYDSFVITNRPVSCMTCIANPEGVWAGDMVSASRLPQPFRPWMTPLTVAKPISELLDRIRQGTEIHRLFEQHGFVLCDDDLKP